MELLGLLFLLFIVVIYSAWSWGFIAYKFYGWFILSSFNNLPHFTILQCVGFCLIISCLTRQSKLIVKDEFRDKKTEIVMDIIAPWIYLFLGWIIYGVFF